MAFRAPKRTLGLLVITLALYVTALVLDMWTSYDYGLRADVGLLQYHVKNANGEQSSTHGMLSANCDDHTALDKHDRKECKIWVRIAGAVFGMICLACLSVVYALYDVAVGTGTQIRPFLLSLLFAITALIVFLAGHEYVRIPMQASSAFYSDSPDVTLGPAFAIFAVGCAFNFAAIGYHVSVCSMRKFEEL